MAAANTDKWRKSKSTFSTTLSGSINDTDATIGLSSVSGLPTDTAITITIDRVDSNGVSTPSKVERVIGVISGSNLTNCVRANDSTTAQSHASGAVVECVWDADSWNDAADSFLVGHDQAGTHKSGSVLTLPQINDTSSDHQYIVAVNELSADRTVTLPQLTGNDEFVFKDHAQTLTNKTLTSPAINTPTLTNGVVATALDMNGTELKLDGDGDTSITADTEDTIDIKINNADDFQFTANTFTALSGSAINTDTIGAATTNHITITPGTSKLVKMAVGRQNITTDTYVNSSVILTGWGFVAGATAQTINAAVTFPITFAAAPIVLVTDPGDISGSDPTAIGDLTTTGAAMKSCQDITTTGFNVYVVTRDSGTNLSNTVRYGFSWIAIGVLS